MHYIRQACLAGLEERYNADPSQVLDLSDEALEKAVAFQYTYVSDQKDWFRACVRERPDVVAKVLIKHVIMLVKAKKEHIEGIYPLAHNDEYASVARCALVRLLNAFPTRAIKKHVSGVLDDLLKAALRYMRDEELKSIIDKKLAVKRMDATQRIYWLAAGFIIDSRLYERALRTFVGNSHTRYKALLLSSATDPAAGSFVIGRMRVACPTSFECLLRYAHRSGRVGNIGSLRRCRQQISFMP